MAKKQFRTESKKLLDMMINSIYTHKEIFLRELISNASDAIDKLYFRSLTDESVKIPQDQYEIRIIADKDAGTLTVRDNGCGMTADELENNLGTIAKSGSFDFKNENEKKEDVDIIGQFGVGFYSAFMVADKIRVLSRPYGSDTACEWESEGADGYTVKTCEKAGFGTEVILYIKKDTDDEKYSDFLDEYRIRGLVKKYSDYIRHPIRMMTTDHRLKEGSKDEYEDVPVDETLNSMIPIWKKNPAEVTEEEYKNFYTEKFFDYEAPAKVITQKSEGMVTYNALLFIPSHAPFNYYTKDYEKGLELYSSGVMIMEKCADLLPDYFSFVKGLVDSSDLSLNISRETLQHDRQLKVMGKAIEKKIKSELVKMLESDREGYEKFFAAFGMQLKYGLYSDYGMHKDVLQDLVMFRGVSADKMLTLKEYTDGMKEEQKFIYYAAGESVEKIRMLPQTDAVTAKGYEVLCLTDDVDEFALKMLGRFADKEFRNVTAENLELDSEDEKQALEKENKDAQDLLDRMKEAIGGQVSKVRFASGLNKHPVCLSSEGELSVEMEKVLNKMPGKEGDLKANVVLEINKDHPIAQTLKNLFTADPAKVGDYAKILYAQARLIGGLSVENPAEISDLICDLMTK